MDEGDELTPDLTPEEVALREQVEASELIMEGLEADLRSVDQELKGLADKAHQYDVLSRVCQSIEELDNLGSAALFWGDHEVDPVGRLDEARRRIDDYGESIARVEQWREDVLDRINEQNVELDCLHYDLNDIVEREENRKAEWLIERDADELPAHVQVMPWARGYEEDYRFRKSLGISVLASIAFAILLSSIALPIVERSTIIEVPERVAKLVRQELPPPPPPVPVEEPIIEEDIPEPEPEPELVEEQPPEEVVPEAPEPQAVAEAEPVDTREQVKSKGILAFRDSFASRASLRQDTQLGSQARVRAAGEDAVGRPERSMVTTLAPGSSGGINLADISRDVGGGGGGDGLGGVEVSRVASSIGNGGTSNRPLSGGAAAGRTDEEIQIVFDRYKAALYRMYNRELRKDPTLRGQMVLRLTIEPDGSVSFIELQSSDMGAPVLAEQVVDRVRTFDFGAKEDIVAVTIIYPIDFLPAV